MVEIMVERVYREKSRETPTSGDPLEEELEEKQGRKCSVYRSQSPFHKGRVVYSSRSMPVGPTKHLLRMIGFGHLDMNRSEWMEGREWRWLS